MCWNMWHDQGEWVTCRQYSILIFQHKSPVYLKCYIYIFWSKPYLNRTSSCGDTNILWSLKTMNNIRICDPFKPVTQNQCSRHPTHSPWSCLMITLYLSALTVELHSKYQYFCIQVETYFHYAYSENVVLQTMYFTLNGCAEKPWEMWIGRHIVTSQRWIGKDFYRWRWTSSMSSWGGGILTC